MATFLSTEEVLSCANQILAEVGVSEDGLSSIKQCNSSVLLVLYEKLTGQELPAKSKGVWSTGSVNEGIRCQHVIDGLSRLLPPEISLNHISGRDIAKHDLLSIKNLLDIFSILFNVPHPLTMPTHRHGYEGSYNESDSNLLTERGIQVINEVLEEELDSAHTHSTPTTFSPHDKSRQSHRAPPTITVPMVTHTNSDTDSDTGMSLTTPIKHPHKPTTPLHSTPRNKGVLTVPSATSTSDDNSIIPPMMSTTPPLSISPLSASAQSVTLTSKTASESSTSTDQLSTLPNEDENGQDDCNPSDGVVSGAKPRAEDHIITGTARDDIIQRIVDNYQQKKDKSRTNAHNNKERTIKVSTLNRSTRKIKGKHSPVLSKHVSSIIPCEVDKLPNTRKQRNQHVLPDHHNQDHQHVLSCVEASLPGMSLSPATIRRHWAKEMKRLKARTSCRGVPSSPMRKKASDIEKRHNALVEVLKKDLNHSRRMQSVLEEKIQRNALQSLIRNQRTATVRAKRYFKDYELAVKAKLQERRTREQKVFRDAYEESLKIMKDRVIEMKRFAREKQLIEVKKYEMQLESVEKYYKDQLQMLASAIKEDERNTRIRDKAHQQDALKAERELRKAMESNITKLWAGLDTWEDNCVHFRELDKEALKKRL